MLLRRERRSASETIEHLVGMQSQVPGAPFVGLWSRLEGFEPAELDTLMTERRAVRTSLMRTTLHLVSASDALHLWPLFRPVHARTFHSQRAFREGVEGIDPEELMGAARELLEAEPLGPKELGRRLAERWPGRAASTLAYAARYWLPIVQVTPRGLWGRTMAPRMTTLDAWLGVSPSAVGDATALVPRYLRTFGPASVADMRTWSTLTGLADVVNGLRPQLRTFRDESGRELLDVEDGPILTGDEEAPVRFLPEYDNLTLSHQDRARIAGSWYPEAVLTRGALLVDGFGVGAWTVRRERGAATLEIDQFTDLSAGQRAEVEAEADALLVFVAPDAESRDARLRRYG
jgi:Winged helix DNA-binding domain